MKLLRLRALLFLRCRSPCGERGLKFKRTNEIKIRGSRSPCGERGLKLYNLVVLPPFLCRSPCGERGLKFQADNLNILQPKSLPMRGAWIEIAVGITMDQMMKSLPMRGAWIEICLTSVMNTIWKSRSPCGERGLKFDANVYLAASGRSLPMQEAWIKIRGSCQATITGNVLG